MKKSPRKETFKMDSRGITKTQTDKLGTYAEKLSKTSYNQNLGLINLALMKKD